MWYEDVVCQLNIDKAEYTYFADGIRRIGGHIINDKLSFKGARGINYLRKVNLKDI